MQNDNEWPFGILAAIVAVIGLFLAALGRDLGMMLFGYGLLVFGTLFAFWSIKRAFDRAESKDG